MEVWFVDDIMPLNNRTNWNQEAFDILLDRQEYCGTQPTDLFTTTKATISQTTEAQSGETEGTQPTDLFTTTKATISQTTEAQSGETEGTQPTDLFTTTKATISQTTEAQSGETEGTQPTDLFTTTNATISQTTEAQSGETEDTPIDLTGATAMQSSSQNGDAIKAIDSNTDADWHSAFSCTQTTYEPYPWWELTLLTNTCIASVIIFNRIDCCKTHQKCEIADTVSVHSCTPSFLYLQLPRSKDKDIFQQLTDHINLVDKSGSIKFTLEQGAQGSLPFLDTLIVIDWLVQRFTSVQRCLITTHEMLAVFVMVCRRQMPLIQEGNRIPARRPLLVDTSLSSMRVEVKIEF
ncbi:uncharacterized protein [Amphiura filiformis]|uniref:uncharacterized protein n=1 Tax=Amphiura filiformis TaxID=82378 RepID=UPI003B218823